MSPVSCFHEIHLHKNELETFQLVQVINSWVCVWAAQDVRLCKAVDGGEDWWFSTTISEPGPRLGPARHRGQKLELVVSCCCCTRCIAVYTLQSLHRRAAARSGHQPPGGLSTDDEILRPRTELGTIAISGFCQWDSFLAICPGGPQQMFAWFLSHICLFSSS